MSPLSWLAARARTAREVDDAAYARPRDGRHARATSHAGLSARTAASGARRTAARLPSRDAGARDLRKTPPDGLRLCASVVHGA